MRESGTASTQQGSSSSGMTQAQAVEMIIAASQAQSSENVQPMDQQEAGLDAQPGETEPSFPTGDQDMQDDSATVMTEATSTSQGLPLAAVVRPARPLQIEEIDAPIAKHSAILMCGVTDFSLLVEARSGSVAQRLAQVPIAVGAASYLTEHTHNTAQSQFVLPKQRNFVTLDEPNQLKLGGDRNQAPMELKMKLGNTFGQCRVRWSDHDYSKLLFRETDPSHFTNNEIYQKLSR